MISTETIPLKIPRSHFHVLVVLYKKPNVLNELKIKDEQHAKAAAMNNRYFEVTARQLAHQMLCDIHPKTRMVSITDAGAAILEGREPTLHSLIRLDKKD